MGVASAPHVRLTGHRRLESANAHDTQSHVEKCFGISRTFLPLFAKVCPSTTRSFRPRAQTSLGDDAPVALAIDSMQHAWHRRHTRYGGRTSSLSRVGRLVRAGWTSRTHTSRQLYIQEDGPGAPIVIFDQRVGLKLVSHIDSTASRSHGLAVRKRSRAAACGGRSVAMPRLRKAEVVGGVSIGILYHQA